MKKVIVALVLILTMFTSTGFAAEEVLIAPASETVAQKDIDVILNGRTHDLDVAPVIVNDRTMVPMRAIFEALGAEVNWIPAGRIIIATKDELMITMQIDNLNMVIERAGSDDREIFTLDAPPFISNDRTLVPARAVSEALGAKVEWIPETRTVTVDQMG